MFQFRKRAQGGEPGSLGAPVRETPAPAVQGGNGSLQPPETVPPGGRARTAGPGSGPRPGPVGPAGGRPRAESPAGPQRPPTANDEVNAPSSQDLLGEHSRRMNLVGGSELAASIDQAVAQALARHLPDVSPEAAREVARSTRGALLLLLKSRSKKVRGLPKAHFLKEVEASKRKIVAEREAARRELEALLEELGQKHVEFRESRETLVRETFDKGVIQDQELSQIIYNALGGPDATPEMRKLQRQLTGMVLESLQRERQRAVDEKTTEHSDELRRYELRIAKLTKSLELTEEELKRIAAMKNVDPGVASIYRTIQGLNADDEHAESKKEMLAGIFQANLALQRQVASAKAG